MFNKPRKTASLQILEALKKRKRLSTQQMATYQRLLSGYKGEKKFATLLKKEFQHPCLSLFDLHLMIDGSECQLDCLLIFQNEILLLDIKNFQGDFFMKDDSLYLVKQKKEIKNPLHQLKRAEILLTQFLTKRQLPLLTIKSYLVFIHPEFHIYQAPHHLPIIYPGQVKRFIRGLHNLPSDMNTNHEKLTAQLMMAHLPRSKYEESPSYEYNQLKRGIVCRDCHHFVVFGYSKRQLICQSCLTDESIDAAVIRSIAEFHLLFPDEKITVQKIAHWCNQMIPKSGIRRILNKNLNMIGYGRGSYYVY